MLRADPAPPWPDGRARNLEFAECSRGTLGIWRCLIGGGAWITTPRRRRSVGPRNPVENAVATEIRPFSGADPKIRITFWRERFLTPGAPVLTEVAAQR